MLPIPEQASTIAETVDVIFLVLVSLSCFFSGIVALLIVYFSVVYRHDADVDRSNAPTGSLFLELAWSLIPLVLGMSVFVWAAVVYIGNTRPPDDALDVYVIGKRWMWKLQHPDGQREINELHVPVDTPVNLIMISQDVIHSFWVPEFRLKQDVLPGRYTQMWFEATEVGEFTLNCAEYCGADHSGMGGRIIVMEPDDYQTWLRGYSGNQGQRVEGEQLFQTLGCASCHQANDSGRGPSLVGLFGSTRQLQTGATVVADENYIRNSIINPGDRIVAGFNNVMPASYESQLNEEELVTLVDYIKDLD